LADRVSPKSVASGGDAADLLADVRRACIDGLSVSTSPKAADVLAGLVDSKDEEESERALRALDAALPSKLVDQARLACANGQKLELAAIAAGQLVRHGHAKARETVLRLHKKLLKTDRYEGEARGQLVRAMVPLLDDPETFDAFLAQASASDADVAEVVLELRDEITAHPEFMAWLLRTGLDRSSELERCLVIRLMTHASDESVTERLVALMRAKEPAIVYSAVRALAERGDRSALPALRKLLQTKDSGRRIEALFGIHALSKDEPGWEDELLELLGSSDRALRATVVDFLADLGSERGLDRVLGDFDDTAWAVRAAAYDYCRRVRARRSIPRLIDRIDVEHGRLREDVLDTLLSLTARRFPTSARWRTWWDEAGDAFEVVPAAAADRESKSTRDPGETRTVTYYDLPLLSDRVAFVVDKSGSMRHTIGTSQDHTRLDEAKRQLGNVVDAMPPDSQFNIVFFDHAVSSTFKQLTKASADARKKALKRVQATKPKGGTNVHDALAAAFADPEVDTIYLLSDGYPSAGPIEDAEALADEVARWNRTRQVRIHCIAIGSESRLLRRIADESGGKYTHQR
ncbi:MAG: HEAT repeat domain-containing protein, partial [Planctomycetes bacterium]|nr:HEAT repeat domain-containing protein [Planctomycetota bacterium]